MANEYDVVVIGAGTGGYVAAIRAAQLGLKTAVVEKQKTLGGTCLIWGCIPTKALLEHAHALKIAKAAKEWGLAGIDAAAVRIDMPAVHARKDKMIAGLTGGIEMLFKKNKIDWIKGTARLTGGRTVEVTLHDGATQALAARQEVIVATGSAARSVPGITHDGTKIIFSDEAIHLPAVPKTIAVMGSGAVGVEFASIFRSYGSEVTIIELLPRLVPGEDEAVSAELEKTFKRRGIKSLTGAKVTAATAGTKGVTVEVSAAEGKAQTLQVDLLLVATGRGPVTEGLGIEALGLKTDRGYIVVDEQFRTSVAGISAIGDVITLGGPHYQLAHVSSMEGVVLAERIAGQTVRPINYDHVPRCTYCEPEIGSVGLTERQAEKLGHKVKVGTFPMRPNAKALIEGHTEGFTKMVADAETDDFLGLHIIGPHATELIAEAALGRLLQTTPYEIGLSVHPHPTVSEVVGEAAHVLLGHPIHI